jgi:hypothetical protein
VNPSSAPWRPRIVRSAGGSGIARESSGRVVSVHGGLVVVAVRGRTVRASLGGDLLAAIAADPVSAPRVGDRVRLRTWADGRVTLERVLRTRPGS